MHQTQPLWWACKIGNHGKLQTMEAPIYKLAPVQLLFLFLSPAESQLVSVKMHHLPLISFQCLIEFALARERAKEGVWGE